MQFRIPDLLLTVWVWGNATGILYLGSRWLFEPHAAQPTAQYPILFLIFIPCGLWTLEGTWWALKHEKQIRDVLGWKARWPMLIMGWLRVPVGFSAAMLTLMVPMQLATAYSMNRLNATGLLIVGVLLLLMALSWWFLKYWLKIRKAYDLEHPFTGVKRKTGSAQASQDSSAARETPLG